jgi:hypothetical protein
MGLRRRLRLLRSLGRDQSGLAVPTALMALIASFGLASAAVISTVNVQQSTKRDHSSKEAIAAADAGANIAMLRLNRFAKSLASYRCVSPSGVAQTPTASGWCPESAEESTGGATYRYAVSAYGGTGIQVVSVGTAGSVTRRVNVSLVLNPEKGVYEGESLIGEEAINFTGSSPTVEANIGTNGSVLPSGGSTPNICGETERVGPGKKSINPRCGVVIEGVKKLPPVSPPADIATNNSNCRLARNCTNRLEVDTVGVENGSGAKYSFTSNRELTVGKNTTLTMGGKNYWLCKLDLSGGGTIYMAAQSEVRIYIDTPEHCGYSSGATQLDIGGGATIRSSAAVSVLPSIYLVGNGGIVVHGTGGTGSGKNSEEKNFAEVMLYAPLSGVELKGNVTWEGAIAGREITINGSVKYKAHEPSKSQQPHYEPLLSRSRYVECGGGALPPGTEPNAGC